VLWKALITYDQPASQSVLDEVFTEYLA
jgi:hypothetical protein